MLLVLCSGFLAAAGCGKSERANSRHKQYAHLVEQHLARVMPSLPVPSFLIVGVGPRDAFDAAVGYKADAQLAEKIMASLVAVGAEREFRIVTNSLASDESGFEGVQAYQKAYFANGVPFGVKLDGRKEFELTLGGLQRAELQATPLNLLADLPATFVYWPPSLPTAVVAYDERREELIFLVSAFDPAKLPAPPP